MNPGQTTVVLAITFTAISGCAVTLRCIARTGILRKTGADDVFAVLSFLTSLAFTYFLYNGYQHGLGSDMQQLTWPNFMLILKNIYLGIIVLGLGMMFLAVSACLQFLRFLCRRNPRILCWVLIVLNSIFGTAALFVDIFSCWPIEYSWNKFLPVGKCIDLISWWYFASTWIVIQTIIIVMIPLVAVKDLQLPRVQKIALIVVFGLGFFDIFTSAARVYAIHSATKSVNLSRDVTPFLYWCLIDLNLGITIICLPTLKVLYVALIGRVRTEKSNLRQTSESIPHSVTLVASNSSLPKIEMDPYAIP